MSEPSVVLALMAIVSVWAMEAAGGILSQLTSSTLLSCCRACVGAALCTGITYDAHGLQCRLHNATGVVPMWRISRQDGGFLFTEVKVFADPLVNLAQFYESVEQGTTKKGYNASLAVDGNKDNAMSHGSCSHTDTHGSWFKLTLDDYYLIERVVITNRRQGTSDWLANFNVTFDGDLCYFYAGTAPAGDVNVTCDGGARVAKIVGISQDDKPLTFCEIELYGE